jgi:hypothetical protein
MSSWTTAPRRTFPVFPSRWAIPITPVEPARRISAIELSARRISARRISTIEFSPSAFAFSERRLAIAVTLHECGAFHFRFLRSERALLLEQSQRSGGDFDSIVSLEQRLECNHFAGCDSLIEHIRELSPDCRFATARRIDG